MKSNYVATAYAIRGLWMIRSPRGQLIFRTLTFRRNDAIQLYDLNGWRRAYRKGYRAVRVVIKPDEMYT